MYTSIIENSSNIKTPSLIGTRYKFYKVDCSSWTDTYGNSAYGFVTVTYPDGTEGSTTDSYAGQGNAGILEFPDYYLPVDEGETKVKYTIFLQTDLQTIRTEIWTFSIFGVANRYPLKPWTVGDVLERIVQLVEPIRKGQTPRFSIAPPTEEKAKLFSQFAPEFTFTRQTLREALQTVGGFIHAEPRLREIEGRYYIDFDYYGEQEYAEYTNYKTGNVKRLNEYKYRTLQSKYGIEQATTKLDSYQDNLVNRLAWEQATTGQPYKNGVQTLRTETAYIRGEENNNFFFPTLYNIDRIIKFEYIHEGVGYDITPYVFEENVYNNLSSFDENYPVSKSYALYYTQGAKGIKGFFYKVASKWGGNVGKKYSIVNIIKAASDINQSENYQDMQFRLTYVPIYSTRVQQSKAYINDYLPLPRILNYTQSDNSVETRYFGENIKGAVSRMGNVEKIYTLNLRNLKNIPKAGQLWDDDYYIASVSVSVNADLFEVSVGLSKNFNRKSQYIGASSYKRIYEVSERMVQQRHTVYTDYIVITSSLPQNDVDNTGLLLNQDGLNAIASIFSGNDTENPIDSSIVCVHAFGWEKNAPSPQEMVMLPVVSSAFGNAMEFTWEYKDNFSAGLKMQYAESGEVAGYFGVEVEYTNYYGRLYYYYFSLLTEAQTSNYNISVNNLPQVTTGMQAYGMAGVSLVENGQNNPLIERKDSREALKKSYVIEFVTDEKDFVIGSSIASENPLVYFNKNKQQPHLYVLKNRVNKFANTVDLSNSVNLGVKNPQVFNNYFLMQNDTPSPIDCEAWAYVIPEYDGESYTVEDEDGVISTITPKLGGNILIACNKTIKKGDSVGNFYGYVAHDAFNYLKEKNK